MKTMIITGASSGLGKTLAEYFAGKAGKEYAVCALARSADVLNEMAKAPNIHAYPCDVGKACEVKDVFARIIEDHERIDVLINNAGIVPQENVFPRDDFTCIDATIDINLKGTMYCSYRAAEDMLPRKDGRIINISSRAGVVGNASGPAGAEDPISFGDYVASKHGVMGFAHAFGRHLLANGIFMTTLCPGGINTPVAESWGIAPEKLMQPIQIAKLIEFILEQEKNILFKTMLFIPPHEWH